MRHGLRSPKSFRLDVALQKARHKRGASSGFPARRATHALIERPAADNLRVTEVFETNFRERVRLNENVINATIAGQCALLSHRGFRDHLSRARNIETSAHATRRISRMRAFAACCLFMATQASAGPSDLIQKFLSSTGMYFECPSAESCD